MYIIILEVRDIVIREKGDELKYYVIEYFYKPYSFFDKCMRNSFENSNIKCSMLELLVIG